MSGPAVPMRTCDGSCCVLFTLPKTKLAIERQLADPKARRLVDGAYILDMIVPLTASEARERAERFGVQPKMLEQDLRQYRSRLFACRHWDTETRLCSAYAARPGMCRDYPYAEPCEHGCAYTPAADVVKLWEKAENGVLNQ